MAQSRQDPAARYRAHATEARAEQAAASSHLATTLHDHAASHHETAARMLENVPRLRARAVAYKIAATAATQRRELGAAAVYADLSAAQDQAAEFSASRAAHWHALGLERSAAARAAEAADNQDEAATAVPEPAAVEESRSVPRRPMPDLSEVTA